MIDLSWYGDTEVTLRLGGSFHSSRLSVRASQVGTVSPAQRGRRTATDRLALALRLLRDPTFDVLLTGSSPLRRAARRHGRAWPTAALPALCHTVTYPEETPCSA